MSWVFKVTENMRFSRFYRYFCTGSFSYFWRKMQYFYRFCTFGGLNLGSMWHLWMSIKWLFLVGFPWNLVYLDSIAQNFAWKKKFPKKWIFRPGITKNRKMLRFLAKNAKNAKKLSSSSKMVKLTPKLVKLKFPIK